MSPSPGRLLFDSNAQFRRGINGEMLHFPWPNINGTDFQTRVRSFRSSYAVKTQGWPKRITERWSRGSKRQNVIVCIFSMKLGAVLESGLIALLGTFSYLSLIYYTVKSDDVIPLKSRWTSQKDRKQRQETFFVLLLRNFFESIHLF